MVPDIADLIEKGSDPGVSIGRRGFLEVLAVALAAGPATLAGAEEKILPYNGPTVEYNGQKVPDLDGKGFAVAPDSLTGSPSQRFKAKVANGQITIVADTDTTSSYRGEEVITATTSYDPKKDQYLLKGKYHWSQPRQGSVDLLGSSVIGSDKTGKVVMEIDFRLFNGKLQRENTYYSKIREL